AHPAAVRWRTPRQRSNGGAGRPCGASGGEGRQGGVRTRARRVLAAVEKDCAGAMKPRVVVLTTYYHPVVGGVEAHARQLVGALHAMGYAVRVVTKRVHRDQPRLEHVDDVPVHRIAPAGERRASGKWLALPGAFGALIALRRDYDVIVCVDYRGLGIAAIAAGRLLNRPVIAQGETAGVLRGPASGSTSGLRPESAVQRALRAPVRAIYRQAD